MKKEIHQDLTRIFYYSSVIAVFVFQVYAYLAGISYGYQYFSDYNLYHEAYMELAIYAWVLLLTFVYMGKIVWWFGS
jgi:hypothetical protein